MQEIVNIIKQKRIELRLTQAQVAQRLNISPKAYSKIETGKNELNVAYLKDLCDILEIAYIDAYRSVFELFPEQDNCDAEGQYTIDRKSHVEYEPLFFKKLIAGSSSFILTRNEYALHKFMCDIAHTDVNDKDMVECTKTIVRKILDHRLKTGIIKGKETRS